MKLKSAIYEMQRININCNLQFFKYLNLLFILNICIYFKYLLSSNYFNISYSNKLNISNR